MGCAGCFRDGKSREAAIAAISEKAQIYANRERRSMVIYLTDDGMEYKFMFYDDAAGFGMDIDWVVFAE